jgi:alpha-L-fucosidase 2
MRITTILALLTICSTAIASPQLWYDKPAKRWDSEALPLGNGSLGCMVFGGIKQEKIQFNVDSLWTGDENPSGKYEKHGMGSYQNFGELIINFGKAGAPKKGFSDYRRTLDLAPGVHTVQYKQDGTAFKRYLFCSFPDQVMALYLTADSPAAHSGSITINGAHGETTAADGTTLQIAGTLNNGLQYEAMVKVIASGGQIQSDKGSLTFTNCDSITILLAAATDYTMDHAKKWRGADAHSIVTKRLQQASAKNIKDLLSAHIKDHNTLFGRVSLDIGKTPEAQRSLPTDQRLAKVKKGSLDPDLVEILFQYGRYLIMASSRPGSLPANLQGVWNNSNKPPWHCDYHSNINLQMNYWLAEPTNLAECHTPLFDLLTASLPVFREGTRKAFPKTKGFTVRTSHNIFGGMAWQWNMPASAWYAQHYWEHYAFTRDKEFLRNQAYPFIKEACQFWESRLVERPDGKLVAPKGWSPEHGPRENGCSYDQQIIWDLFNNYIAATKELNIDADYAAKIKSMQQRLLGPKIGRWGQLQEWVQDRDNPKDGHRHTSHLFAVYPGHQISLEKTPELAKAAAISLEARGETGDSRRSWTWPWRCALWARLGNAAKCHHMIYGLLKYNTMNNLITTHRPLQLDGSFGITGGICEMLLQSHTGTIALMPAIPKEWSNGSAIGLKARGGFSVNQTWQDGKLTTAIIVSQAGQPCTVHYGDKTASFKTVRGGAYTLDENLKLIKTTKK